MGVSIVWKGSNARRARLNAAGQLQRVLVVEDLPAAVVVTGSLNLHFRSRTSQHLLILITITANLPSKRGAGGHQHRGRGEDGPPGEGDPAAEGVHGAHVEVGKVPGEEEADEDEDGGQGGVAPEAVPSAAGVGDADDEDGEEAEGEEDGGGHVRVEEALLRAEGAAELPAGHCGCRGEEHVLILLGCFDWELSVVRS